MTTQETEIDQKAAVQAVYQEIAAEYDERIPGYTKLDERFASTEHEFITSRLQQGDRVLDIGCGTGRLSLQIAAHVGGVTGLDMSESMLVQAREKTQAAGLTADFQQGDMTSMPFPDNSFDAVVSMLALMHVPVEQRTRLFAEISRVLRPGGRVLVGVKNGVFERMSKADRFATVDLTDVEQGELVFTNTRSGSEFRATWNSFTPSELRYLCAVNDLVPTTLRGNIPISAWLDSSMLDDTGVWDVVCSLEQTLADIPPLNELGYHLLFEAVKPLRR